MIYSGNAIKVTINDSGIIRLHFDLEGESVNKFNQATLQELREALAAIHAALNVTSNQQNTSDNNHHELTQPAPKGLLITSGKSTFLVGADITEFPRLFAQSRPDFIAMNEGVNRIFSTLEDLSIPSVVLINGLAFGGGFEICLAADYRIMSVTASVALPEVKLGLMPGWGGTVRLPRLVGVDQAAHWISQGIVINADDALQHGAVDEVVASTDADTLIAQGELLLEQCFAGTLNYQSRKQQKRSPLSLAEMTACQLLSADNALPEDPMQLNYPAPVMAMQMIKQHANLPRDAALQIETDAFISLCQSQVANNLVGMFLGEQKRKRQVKQYRQETKSITQAAVLGAGIMGGGIAYQSAYKGIPIVMKDIAEKPLALGMGEAKKLLTKLVDKGRMDTQKLDKILRDIHPTLDNQDLVNADFLVEAVVENLATKRQVLSEMETVVAPDAIITSNTSTISINQLAQNLQNPQRFCGMHFFNPVSKMPLVEVIRGQDSSPATIAAVVVYADSMGKKPIVVNDCPGFFVNRVLFPYLDGFGILLEQGVNVVRIDQVMESFGWPMGPAALIDIIGMDTTHHCQQVLAEGFPERMTNQGNQVIQYLYEKHCLGRKSGAGFYCYSKDVGGQFSKTKNNELNSYLKKTYGESDHFSDQMIVDVLMIPLCLEVARCLHEGIVASPTEADLALIYGLGFPTFMGGACRYMDSYRGHYTDSQGITAMINTAESLSELGLGPLYKVPDFLYTMAAQHEKFINDTVSDS